MGSKENMTQEEQIVEDNLNAEAAQAAEGEEQAGASSPDLLDERIAELEAQLVEVQQRERDIVLRARAEVENLRRRTELDVEKAHKFALEKFSIELLPVIDNLERAIELADKNNETLIPMIEGVELTLKSFLDVARKFGIERVDQVNVPFNPEVHEAMTMIPTDEQEPNQVILMMQKGYTLNGRLIRPAMVGVSKATA